MPSKFTAIPLTSLSHKAARLNDVDAHSSKQSLLSRAPVESNDVKSIQLEPLAKPWASLMLQRWVLLTISIVLLALIVGLEIVVKSSTDKRGFGPAESDLHYVWTYGSTAVFTLVAAFWTQVDYRTRQMQPWRRLAEKPQLSSKTLFLDYISPHPVSSFAASLQHRHWRVTAVLFGSILLKIVIVICLSIQSPSSPITGGYG
ncbi:Nn.00g028230.m01.CDS01 [Neocucurbitaria sp. VM-36]